MYKAVTILYLVCLACYVLFTRQPDYFDGETTPATIQMQQDSTCKAVAKAVFSVGATTYAVPAAYLFRNVQQGQRTTVIYTSDHPERGTIYSVWGYWLQWGELLGGIILYIVLFQVAVAITSNPTHQEDEPEAPADQPLRKRRYDV